MMLSSESICMLCFYHPCESSYSFSDVIVNNFIDGVYICDKLLHIFMLRHDFKQDRQTDVNFTIVFGPDLVVW